MKALVDADTFPWRYAAAGEYDLYQTKEGPIRGKKAATKIDPEAEFLEHVIDDVENVLHSVKVSLQRIMQVVGDDSPRLFLGGKGSFRKELYPPYKSSREGREKPHHYNAVKDYLLNYWKAEICRDGLEADDECGIWSDEDTVICSQDKDLLQIAGFHYNFVKDEKLKVGPKRADIFLYTQILTGDSTDDIPGLKGIGPAKAAEILKGATSKEELFSKTLKAYDGDLDAMELTAHLVYLLRADEDSVTKRKEWDRG